MMTHRLTLHNEPKGMASGLLARRHSALQRMMCALLVACLLFSGLVLAGCKYTDVMTQHIENEELGTLDPDAEPYYKDVPDAEPDPTKTSSQVSDSERIDEQQQTLPNYEEDQDNPEDTENREHVDNDYNSLNASEGTEQSDTEEQTPEDSGTDGIGTEEQPTPATMPTGRGGTGQTYDASGESIELPENTHTVAAAGQYATIVQMLAGGGVLTGTDAAWQQTVAAKGLFPGEGVESATVIWTGSETLGYTVNMDALIALAPDAVISDGVTVAFTAEQQAQLSAAQIDLVVMPALAQSDTADADIVAAVNTVGQLLSTATGAYDATAMASKYEKLHDDMVEASVTANGGYSFKMVNGTAYQYIYQGTGTGIQTTRASANAVNTAYIDGWTTSVASSSIALRTFSGQTIYLDGQTIDSSTGAGTSAVSATGSFILLDYYLQCAGMIDNAYEGAKPATASSGVVRPYLVIPGGTQNLILSSDTFASRTAPSALWFARLSSSSSNAWTLVGNADYPVVLTATDDIARKVVASAEKVNGLYNVGQPYTVRVVPSGLAGSWSKGTVESYLLTMWAGGMYLFSDGYTTANQNVDTFYTTFYRYGGSATADGIIDNYGTEYQAKCPTS